MNRFDTVPCRLGSDSYKWDKAPAPDVIPLWVADMDFMTAPVVIEALKKRAAHGIFGYTTPEAEYYDALTRWFENRHSWNIDRDRVIVTPGVVPALSAIIKALAPAGSGVIFHTPAYNCYFSSVRNNGCRVVETPLLRKEAEDGLFTFEMDFDDLERKAADPSNRLLLLCNPHNPGGRLWSRGELERMAEICRRHGVTVVSDEIHCELTAPGTEYVPYSTVDSSAVVCVSPSKAFNTAGLHIANIVCPDTASMEIIDRAVNINEVCDVGPFGVEALKAAYTTEGATWLDELRGYLWQNYAMMVRMMKERLPQYPVSILEATYLPMIDVSHLTNDTLTLEKQLLEEARVWVNAGEMYGRGGYLRINLACPRNLLKEGLDRLINYLIKQQAH